MDNRTIFSFIVEMLSRMRFIVIALTLGCSGSALAQDAPKLSWLDRATITRSSQPDWVTPLITASANLEEAPIYDISRKLPTDGRPLMTAGGPRGMQFVPFGKLQVTFGATPYLLHNDHRVHDGFGDTSFAFKYRLVSGNEHHGGFAVSAQMGASIPTGSYQNGQKSATLTPNILAEKGWGPFNIQRQSGSKCALDVEGSPSLRLDLIISSGLSSKSMQSGSRAAPMMGKSRCSLLRVY